MGGASFLEFVDSDCNDVPDGFIEITKCKQPAFLTFSADANMQFALHNTEPHQFVHSALAGSEISFEQMIYLYTATNDQEDVRFFYCDGSQGLCDLDLGQPNH